MELKLVGGDYVPDGAGGFLRCTGVQGVLMGALYRLTCRRGSFPLQPELGSRMYTLLKEKPASAASAARVWAVEALAELPVMVQEVTVTPVEADGLQVEVGLDYRGENAVLEVLI